MLAYLGIAAAIAYLSVKVISRALMALSLEADLSPARAVASWAAVAMRRRLMVCPLPAGKIFYGAPMNRSVDDRLLAVAAGVVFYGLLALFPAVTALVSCYALVVEPQTINDHLAFLSSFTTEGTFSIVQSQVGRVFRKAMCNLAAPSFSAFSWLFGAPMAA